MNYETFVQEMITCMKGQLSAEEQRVVDALRANNDLQINLLTVKTGIPISRLSALLFTLEMKGVVRSLAGGMYHLLK